jgi:hypothetical protein
MKVKCIKRQGTKNMNIKWGVDRTWKVRWQREYLLVGNLAALE